MWSAIKRKIDDLSSTRCHPNLPDMIIPDTIVFTKSIEEVCVQKDIILFAVPSVFVRSTAEKARQYIPDGQIVVDVAKGIEADTLYTMSEVFEMKYRKMDYTLMRRLLLCRDPLMQKKLPATCQLQSFLLVLIWTWQRKYRMFL